MVLRVVGDLLLLLLLLLGWLRLGRWRRRWPLRSLNLLNVGRLVLRRTLGSWVLRRGIVCLCRALRGDRGMRRVRVVLVLLVDHAGPRMVHRKMIWRWQALRRVWVMLKGAPGQQGWLHVQRRGTGKSKSRMKNKKKRALTRR